MTFRIIYMDDYSRIINGIIIDSQYNISAIKNKLGFEIKNYCDSQIALINDNNIPYKVESEFGNVALYFTVQTPDGNSASIGQVQIRPAYEQFSAQISQLLNTFINSNSWLPDYLN